jgi:NTE family protein
MPTSHFRNLVFEGGGVKGIAYVGALEVLDNRGILDRITRVGGTSTGAIAAVLLALGYRVGELQEILWDLEFERFMDDSWGAARDTRRLFTEFGWHKGDFFRAWIAERIREKTGNPESTFGDLEWMRDLGSEFRRLYLVGTNLSTGFAETFSAEHTPGIPVADAARISMSIPLFFCARRNLRGDLYVDGGMLDNYPVKLFDRRKYVVEASLQSRDYYTRANAERGTLTTSPMSLVYNQETLGFRLDSKREIDVFRGLSEPPRHRIDDFFDYGGALVRTVMNVQASQHLHSDDWHRTIYVDTLGVGTTEFALSDARKWALVAQGRLGAEAYFEWFEDDDRPSWNRPGNEPRNELGNESPPVTDPPATAPAPASHRS